MERRMWSGADGGGGKGRVGGRLGGALRLDRLRFGVWACVAGWWCGACAGGGTGALVGDLACDAGAPACGGCWIVACGVCSPYAAPLRLPVLLGDFFGGGPVF